MKFLTHADVLSLFKGDVIISSAEPRIFFKQTHVMFFPTFA